MPQPITPTDPAIPREVPRQSAASRSPSARQLREQDWRTLVATFRLLSRLTVERTKHHLADDADTLARQAALVEEELEHVFPFRWPQRRPELLHEQATWWAEPHEDDVLTCRSCRLQMGGTPERIILPAPRRTAT
jgi:hypothetical protein